MAGSHCYGLNHVKRAHPQVFFAFENMTSPFGEKFALDVDYGPLWN